MRVSTLARVGLWAILGTFAFSALAADRSLVEQTDAPNQSLLVGVSHGLPGIDLDVANAKRMGSHSAYNFQPRIVMDTDGTKANVAKELTAAAQRAGTDGSLFFYYSGHGSPGSIYLQDGSLAIDKIRQALEDGRAGMGPMQRLIFMSDSCYSGSLLDPMRLGILNEIRDPAILRSSSSSPAGTTRGRRPIGRSSSCSRRPGPTRLHSPEKTARSSRSPLEKPSTKSSATRAK